MSENAAAIADCVKLASAIRQDVLYMTKEKKAGFIGSSFSCADILAVLYGGGFVGTNTECSDNDVFILSKGHAASAWYAALANVGVIERSRLFTEFNTDGYNMGVHPKRGSLPGIISSTGSLGQGVGLACGAAIADRILKRDRRVYVLLGDGECNEGSIWESFMLAARQKLSKLTIIIDRNKLQSYGHDHEILDMGDIAAKLRSFGLHTLEADGHDCASLYDALTSARERTDTATAIVADTIKGKGVKEFEGKVLWHYKWPEEEHMETARKELGIV